MKKLMAIGLGCFCCLLSLQAYNQSNIIRVEYYIDTDPGFGNATAVSITPGTDLSDIELDVNTGILTEGVHVLGLRAQDEAGNWSHDNTLYFEIASILPAHMLHFDASHHSNAVVLNWKTGSEQNTSHFIIERSANGILFAPIGKVQSAGNSSTVKDYSFTDKEALNVGATKLYYRLQQVDADGSYEYCKSVSVTIPATALFSISPNPAGSVLQLKYRISGGAQQALIYVTDISGKKVLEQQINSGTILHSINLANLSKGLYYLTVRDNGIRQIQRFVKQ